MTIDELDEFHEGREVTPIVSRIPLRRIGQMARNRDVPEATPYELVTLRDNLCPVCGMHITAVVWPMFIFYACTEFTTHKYIERIGP